MKNTSKNFACISMRRLNKEGMVAPPLRVGFRRRTDCFPRGQKGAGHRGFPDGVVRAPKPAHNLVNVAVLGLDEEEEHVLLLVGRERHDEEPTVTLTAPVK